MSFASKLTVVALLMLPPVVAEADFPDLATRVVLPGCQIARSMDATDASMRAASETFAKDGRIGMGAAYCAAWAAEAFDRYAGQPDCFTNDMSIDDLILVVLNYAARHSEYADRPFLLVADGAILDRWPDCVTREK